VVEVAERVPLKRRQLRDTEPLAGKQPVVEQHITYDWVDAWAIAEEPASDVSVPLLPVVKPLLKEEVAPVPVQPSKRRDWLLPLLIILVILGVLGGIGFGYLMAIAHGGTHNLTLESFIYLTSTVRG
jgi:hypothetical protein